MREGTGIVMFTDLLIRLLNETLEQIDEAIEDHPALENRQEFIEAVEYALSNLKEESEMFMLALEDE
jgi:hypothetical protein